MLLECENGKNIKKEHSSQPETAVPEKTLIGHLFQGLQFVFIKREFPLFLPDIELLWRSMLYALLVFYVILNKNKNIFIAY